MIEERNGTYSQGPLFEFALASVALLGLLFAEAMLCSAIHATNFNGGDGKMAQAVILAALKFGGLFSLTNINPIMGLGSQLLPMNVWINPAYWPFAFLDRELATDVSAIVALGVFASATYIMARCFDLSPILSAVAAQLCILIFAPMLWVLDLPTVFSLMTGNGVVYAPHMIALGLLGQLEPTSWRNFAVVTASVFALLLYSLCCDPLWSVVSGFSWVTAFAVVAFGVLKLKTVLIRLAALAGSFALLLASGALEYIYTLTRYTARVQFSTIVDRVRVPDYHASTLFYSPNTKYFFLVWSLGWLLGILLLKGRTRLLVIATLASFGVYCGLIIAYVLLANAS